MQRPWPRIISLYLEHDEVPYDGGDVEDDVVDGDDEARLEDVEGLVRVVLLHNQRYENHLLGIIINPGRLAAVEYCAGLVKQQQGGKGGGGGGGGSRSREDKGPHHGEEPGADVDKLVAAFHCQA